MIIFKAGETPPEWCELREFEVENLKLGKTIKHERRYPRERILMTRGRCNLSTGSNSQVLRAGQFYDPEENVQNWTISASTDDCEFIRCSGAWGEEIAGCGVWILSNEDNPADTGDPVDYPKQTSMDNHYHDYDEYWFILSGSAQVAVSGERQDVVAGDCIAIAMGHHHDMPIVHGEMRGAFFETSLCGQKRLGHLWNHTHGQAIPRRDCT